MTVRVLVLGHSGTAGFGLESPAQTWPALLAQQVSTPVRPCDVTTVQFHPVGTRAVEFATTKIESLAPDLVVISINAYPCAIPVVSESVRVRFGRRAERFYLRFERRIERRSNLAGPVAETRETSRRWARRILGARPVASVAEVAGVYTEVLRRSARLEGVQVLCLAEAAFSAEVRMRVPTVVTKVRELHDAVHAVANEHRFDWCDASAWVEPDCGYWHADGVHLSAKGNEQYADRLTAVLAQLLPRT